MVTYIDSTPSTQVEVALDELRAAMAHLSDEEVDIQIDQVIREVRAEQVPDDDIGNGNPADPEGELPTQPDEEAEEVAAADVDDDDGEQT